MFLFGLYAVKTRFVDRLPNYRLELGRLMGSSLVIGLITNYAWKSGQAMHLASNVRIAAEILSGPSLALFYACALALMMQSDFWRKWIGVLRWPGRMALTNYIAQTTIVTAIYYGWGFGLMKKTTTLQAVATAISVFAVLTAASAVWLHYFQFGPLEWLWRSAAEAKLQPIRSVLPKVTSVHER